jgi:hypothetical protein
MLFAAVQSADARDCCDCSAVHLSTTLRALRTQQSVQQAAALRERSDSTLYAVHQQGYATLRRRLLTLPCMRCIAAMSYMWCMYTCTDIYSGSMYWLILLMSSTGRSEVTQAFWSSAHCCQRSSACYLLKSVCRYCKHHASVLQ